MNKVQCRRVALGAVLALPAVALAGASHTADSATVRQAAQNCSRALAHRMGTQLAAEAYVPVQRDPSDVFRQPDELTLTAVRPHSRRVLATAVCYYNESGLVQSLAVYPPNGLTPGFMETAP